MMKITFRAGALFLATQATGNDAMYPAAGLLYRPGRLAWKTPTRSDLRYFLAGSKMIFKGEAAELFW